MELNLNQLEKLVNDYQHDNHDGYVSNTGDWLENWIEQNTLKSDLNSVIKSELEKFVEWYNNEYATPILPIDKEDIKDYLNQAN